MEYVGLVFGIFGLMAYLSVSSLKNRVSRLERELQAMQGNNYSLERASLAESLKSRIGEPILLTFREDEQDIDCMMLGRKTGAITLLDSGGDFGFGGHLGADFFVFANGLKLGAVVCGKNVVAYGGLGIEKRILWQIADSGTFVEHDGAFVRGEGACNRGKERGFSGAVAADDGGFFAFVHAECDAGEQW